MNTTPHNGCRTDTSAVESPCIGECKLTQGVCTGCYRDKAEIKLWGGFNDLAKTCLMVYVDARRKRIEDLI
jgi:predicted Fe-S protein YdhL (DUF1289 family)